MKQAVRYFVRGCLVLAPVTITLYVLYFAFTTIDQMLGLDVPGLGFVLTIGLVTLVGFFTSNVVGRSVVDITERFFTRLPLVKLLYSSIKDLIGAFMGQRQSFNQPVAVAVAPDGGIKVLGFITRSSLTALGLHDHVAVYLPQSYNVAGNLIVVPRDRVQPLDTSTSELITFLVSGGVSGLGVGQSIPPPPPSHDVPPQLGG